MLWVSNKWKKGCAGVNYGPDWEAARDAKVVRLVFRENIAGAGDVTILREARAVDYPYNLSFAPLPEPEVARHAKSVGHLNTWGRKPRSHHPQRTEDLYKMPTTQPCRRRRASQISYKSAHIEPIVWQGKFSVPDSAITGMAPIDMRNVMLVEKYSKISRWLEKKQVAMRLAKVTDTAVWTSDGSFKKYISRIRSEGLALRKEVIALGGKPLFEPVSYWRYKYEDVVPF